MGFVSFPKSGKNEKLEILIILGVLEMMMIGFWLKMRSSLINERCIYMTFQLQSVLVEKLMMLNQIKEWSAKFLV